jgi:pimeloyl-ACP methyl ester carboxylesterase
MDAAKKITWPRFKTQDGRARYLAVYDAALKNWPVPYASLEVPTHLGPTHVIASGPADAPPLILLPSFAGSALAWRPNVEALSREQRVYAVDVIGQPGRSLATRRVRGRRACARWLAEVMDGLGIEKASFVGCSFGGFLAANQALLTPERVDRLVLIGPVGVFANMSPALGLRMRAQPVLRWFRRALGDRRPPQPLALHGGAAPIHPEDDGWRRLMGVTMAESARVSLTRATVFSVAELDRITAPTLLLIGEYEMLYPPQATLERAKRLKPGIEAEIVEGADHIAAMAQPAWVNARIGAFLRREPPLAPYPALAK